MPRVSSTARSLHREHTSTPALLRLSASAAAMNAVIPLALAVQIALLGRLHRSRGEGATTQAAFGLCVTSCGVGVTVFNFLVDGVTAKVGERVGARRWRAAAGRVRMAIAAALACGCVATGALLALRETLFALFAIEGSDVAVRARTYYAYRALGIAPQCVASSLGGCLGGYRRVHAATALSTTRAMVETIAVASTLTLSADADVVMRRIGIAYVLVVVAHALVGGALVLGLTPEGAPGPLAILPAKWARARRRGSDDAAGDDGDDGDGDATTHPSPYRDASAPERARGEDGEVSPRDERGEAERGAPQRGRARGVALDGDDDSLLRVVVEDLARRARLRMRRRTRRRSAARGRHRAAGCASRAGEDATRSTREGGRDEARARAKANAREDGSVVIAYSSRSSHKSFSPTPRFQHLIAPSFN
jgi:hypothetical protein